VALLFKKEKPDQSHVLGEKEIQERLYGNYHRPERAKSVATTERPRESFNNSSQSVTQAPVPVAEPKVPFGERVRSAWTKFEPGLESFLKSFPWKFAAMVIGGLVAVILFFQGVTYVFEGASHWLEERRESSEARLAEKEAIAERADKEAARAAEERDAIEEARVSSAGDASMSELPPVGTPTTVSAKSYGVQVCTYQRENDARRLVAQLKNSNFDAFYRESRSRALGIPFFEVFLGRANSYQIAKDHLATFKQSNLHTDFQDSFIRSL